MEKKVLLIKIDKAAGGPLQLSFSEPIGLCYISAYLKERKVNCRLLHTICESAEYEIMQIVGDYVPNYIGFSIRNFNFNSTARCIKRIRSTYPSIKIILGGECITLRNAANLLRRANADVAVVSDGEEAIYAYLTGQNPQNIAGIVYRDDNNGYNRSLSAPCQIHPAELPMMDRTGLPMCSYTSSAFPGKRYATMHTQRGCRYKCTFCHTASRYNGHASRTIEQIMTEIDYLSTNYHTEAIAIWDEDFFSDPDRVENIVQELLNRNSPIEWQTFMKLTDLKNSRLKKILPKMRESGYLRAVIGLESFIPKTLRHYHKTGGPNVEESLQYLSAQGIRICPSYIIGEPDETEEDIRNGLSQLLQLKDLGIDIELPYITFLTPFPDTPLYDSYVKKGLLIDDNWDNYDGEHVLLKGKCPPDKLLRLRDWFYEQFYG